MDSSQMGEIRPGFGQYAIGIPYEPSRHCAMKPERLELIPAQARPQHRLHIASMQPSVGANPDVRQFAALAEVDQMLTGRPQQDGRLRSGEQFALYRHVSSIAGKRQKRNTSEPATTRAVAFI
jgi:hypothetical protein